MSQPFFTNWMDLSTYYAGQHRAHIVSLERIEQREKSTAIVLPCGYGKSDLVRNVILEAWTRKLISCGLVLSPTANLREQFVAEGKITKWMGMYDIQHSDQLKFRTLKYVEPNFTSNGEFLVSATISLIQRNIDLFVRWVNSQCHTHGIPPLICVDEAQMEGVENSWGHAIERLMQEGALVLLATATPMRSDGRPLVGFPCVETNSEEEILSLLRKTDDPRIRECLVYLSTIHEWTLQAHHETTFAEGWGEDVLAEMEQFNYDVRCEEFSSTASGVPSLISDIPPSRVSEYLGKIVREPGVMREGVRRFCEALDGLKQNIKEMAGIIFVCNDLDADDESNAHAKAIERLVREYQPHWQTLIVTSADEDLASNDLARFCHEKSPCGDVLIVKQMASRGSDAPRCKVVLDLSPIRTEVSWTQRIMRANRKYKGAKAIIIGPNDIISTTLFAKIVQSDTARTQTYRTIEGLIDQYPVEINPRNGDDWRALFIGEPTNASFSDSNLVYAGAEDQPVVRFLYERIPALALLATRSATAIHMAGWIPPAHLASRYSERPDIRAIDERKAIGIYVGGIVRARLGPNYTPDDFSRNMAFVWTEVKDHFGLRDINIGQVSELSILADIKRYVTGMEQGERQRYRTTHRS